MKKLLALILTLMFVACERKAETPVGDDEQFTIDNGQWTIDEPQNEPETNVGDGVLDVPLDEPETPAIIEKIPLANGAVLLIEDGNHNNATLVSIQLNDNSEPLLLLRDWNNSNYRISPDLTKIAYIIHDDKSTSGSLYVFDVIENKSVELEFDDYAKPGQSVFWDESKGMRWLDNEILLTIGKTSHFGWSRGGSVHYYNVTNGSNRKIIPHIVGEFQIINIEIDGEELILTINRERDKWDDMININVPLATIYELIENGEVLILDVPAIEEPVILEEIPLANGAMLIIEKKAELEWSSYYMASFSVVYEDESVFLFETWTFNERYMFAFEISPDLTKIAYLYHNYDHRGGTLNIFDVLERENFQPFERDYFYQYIFKYDINRYYVPADILWLDDEILLILSTYPHGSSGGGGDIFYHNITDGTTRAIIPYDINHFWLFGFKEDGDNLKLSIARDRGGRNFFRDDMIDMYVPLSQIYELIENGGTLILDVPPIEVEE